jgi:hypothetical protein
VGSVPVPVAVAHLGDLLLSPDHLFPVTSEFSAWYAGDFVLALVISLALAVYGFYTSLAGQSLFHGSLLKE